MERRTGALVPLPGKAFWLLAYLLLEGRKGPVRRSSAAAMLWDGSDRQKAHANLRTLLARMQAPVVTGDRQSVWLAGSLSIDVEQLTTACGQPSADAISSLCELYRGDLLAGLDLDLGSEGAAWLQVQATHLRELVIAALTEFLNSSACQGRSSVIEKAARRLIQVEAFQEAPYHALMKLYASTGRPKDLRSVYDELASALRSEIGVKPSEATTTLYRELVRKAAPAVEPVVVAFSHAKAKDQPTAIGAGRGAVPRLCILLPRTSRATRLLDIAASLLEDVAVGLCRLRSVAVIAPYTAARLSGDPIEAARNLDVDFVAETRLAHLESDPRLIVKLFRTGTRQMVWAETFPFALIELPQRHSDISTMIATTLAEAVERAELGHMPSRVASAYCRFLEGQRFMRVVSLKNVRRARGAFRDALEAEPDFMLALSGLARTKIVEWLLLGRPDKDLLAEARRLAQASVDRDRMNAHGFDALGRAQLFLGALDESLESLSHAERLPQVTPTSLPIMRML
jgi:DNA-binding SARP family transcriptional activator/TolB-like protein